jgi:hypothetical protein
METNMTKHIIDVQGNQVKLYVNADNSQVVVFPPFGRYYKLSSDTDAMTFALTFLIAKNNNNVVTLASYMSRNEDTAIIQLSEVA